MVAFVVFLTIVLANEYLRMKCTVEIVIKWRFIMLR